jgi:methylmalonyl-CoA mutase N-terminal domain/subunit
VVGVNGFADTAERGLPTAGSDPPTRNQSAIRNPQSAIFSIDPSVELRQVERVRALRAGRSTDAWRAAIDSVVQAARSGSNLVPPIIAAVEASATVGEIADALRGVFGEYTETAAL